MGSGVGFPDGMMAEGAKVGVVVGALVVVACDGAPDGVALGTAVLLLRSVRRSSSFVVIPGACRRLRKSSLER